MFHPKTNITSGEARTIDISKRLIGLLAIAGGMLLSAVAPALAQPGTILSHEKISDSEGGSFGFLDDDDVFGDSVASLGDLDGDGIGDLAVGARLDDDGGLNRGAVWIQFLNADGSVNSQQKISDTEGGFTGILDNSDAFGISVASLGDHDGPGPSDHALAVGAFNDDDGGTNRGAVWILFLNVDTTGPDPVVTVSSHHKISDTSGDLPTALGNNDRFAWSLAALCDIDNDDIGDLAVGADLEDDGGTNRGAVWILLLNANGTVKFGQKISDTEGGFTGELDDNDQFGTSVAFVGDLDDDGVSDLAVGARQDDDGGTNRGAVWILFLNSNGTVKSHQKISDTEGGFTGVLDNADFFGVSVASLCDLDGDGISDLAVGAHLDDDGATPPDADYGAVWILFLRADGTVKSKQKISDTAGGFPPGELDHFDLFGLSVASLGDHDGDGVSDLAVGAFLDDDGGHDRGAVWILFLDVDTTDPDNPVVTVSSHEKISDSEGGSFGFLNDSDRFGNYQASLGDLDGDGIADLAVGARTDDDGGTGRGAVWILFLNADGTVKSKQKISDTEGGFAGMLDNSDLFGSSVASLGDLDGDGIGDLAVGARQDDDEGTNRGAVWILFLNSNGTVKSHQKISDTAGGFDGVLGNSDIFGTSVSSLGDLDGDGIGDLAVGARQDDDGGANRGAVWILFLNGPGKPGPDGPGTVKSHQKISDIAGGFTGALGNGDVFGVSVASLGDLDGDGVTDLAVGASSDDDGGTSHGAVWILFLNGPGKPGPDGPGTVKSHQKISDTAGGFDGVLDNSDLFGISVASLCDLDGDGIGDLAVGAHRDDDGCDEKTSPNCNHGAVWILFLNSDGTVKAKNGFQKISATEGGFTGDLDDEDLFGLSVASLGDLDGNGVCDLAVGAMFDDDGGTNRGAVWVLFLDGCSVCPADFDCDGQVRVPDLIIMLSAWGPNPGHLADLDGNGEVRVPDLILLLAAWGACS